MQDQRLFQKRLPNKLESILPALEPFKESLEGVVVESTFNWFSENRVALDGLGMCSINLSGNTLSDESFSDFLLEQFVKYRIPSEKICFEITETAAIANLDIAQRFIHSFSNELRCKFSLDDFGTGLSSFAYLKNFAVDILKIDGGFIRDISDNRISESMVAAITQVAMVMELETVAEYVENDKTRELVANLGVHYAQGHAVGRPTPLEDVLAGLAVRTSLSSA